MGSTTILNEMGDTTITWTEDNEAYWIALIQKKMEEGVSFFIIERDKSGAPTGRQKKLTGFEEDHTDRTVVLRDKDITKIFVVIPDADLQAAVADGKGEPIKTPRGAVTRSRRTKDPKEASATSTVAVKPRTGG